METQTQKLSFDELIAQNDELIARAETFLQQNGTKFPLTDWVTPAEYAKRFGLKSTNVVSNWIRRGIIPPENIFEVPELNNKRLIKAIPYRQ